jgi:hypothetical protein
VDDEESGRSVVRCDKRSGRRVGDGVFSRGSGADVSPSRELKILATFINRVNFGWGYSTAGEGAISNGRSISADMKWNRG